MQMTYFDNINSDRDICCYFLEHSFVNPQILAELSVQVKNQFLFESSDVFLLVTCQRIELYSKTLKNDPFVDIFGFRSQYIYGCLDVYRRLVQIACGLRSQILGEKFIYTQLKKAIHSLPKEHPIYLLGCSALDISQVLRKKHGFYANTDYEEIVLKLLNMQSLKRYVSILIIIGGGHLAQAIANAQSNTYSQVIIITREAKRLRKDFLDSSLLQIYSIYTLPSHLLTLPFHCFIATNNLNNEYFTSLLGIINHSSCQAVVDMSSVPMFSEHTLKDNYYTTMYDESYFEVIKATNFLLRPRIPNLISDIEDIAPVSLMRMA